MPLALSESYLFDEGMAYSGLRARVPLPATRVCTCKNTRGSLRYENRHPLCGVMILLVTNGVHAR